MTTAIPGKTAATADERAVLPRPYEEQRLQFASHSQGETMILTLPEAEEIDEGEQDCNRFTVIGPRLSMQQWLIITNDAGSYWSLMRVERIHGGRGLGLRGLTLRYIAPPYRADKDVEAPVTTGEYHIHYGGAFKKWQIIAPNGQVRAEGINGETEARNRCIEMERNAGGL